METTILRMQDETIELSSDICYQQPTRITEREVWEVANRLWAKKIDPSSNKVRELLRPAWSNPHFCRVIFNH